MGRAFEASTVWDPAKGFSLFSSYLYFRTRGRIIDWVRKQYGDGRYGTALTKRGLELKDVAISESTVEIASLIEEALFDLNLDEFTPETRQVLLKVCVPMAEEEISLGVLAQRYGSSRRDLNKLLETLREELREQLAA